MNGVMGLTEMMQESPLGSPQRERMARLKSSPALPLHVLNDIRDVSKLEAEKLSLERIRLDVRETVWVAFENLLRGCSSAAAQAVSPVPSTTLSLWGALPLAQPSQSRGR